MNEISFDRSLETSELRARFLSSQEKEKKSSFAKKSNTNIAWGSSRWVYVQYNSAFITTFVYKLECFVTGAKFQVVEHELTPSNEHIFTIELDIGPQKFLGVGLNKKEAKNAAAEKAMEWVGC